MQYDLNTDSVNINVIQAEVIADALSIERASAVMPVAGVGNDHDSVLISDEALYLASLIVPSIQEQDEDGRFNMLVAIQGGFVGPGGAMINIASSEDPVYAVVKNDSITIYNEDIYSPQSAYEIRLSTARMLEYVQLLMRDVKIEDGNSLEEKLMNMTNSLANIQGELVGDPNYSQKNDSLEEAFRNITSIMIADFARVEYSELPDNDQMILEAREMADMFNNLLFENLIKYDVKKSFDNAWSEI